METELHFLLRLGIAVFLGGILGWDRESLGKAAGLRTHILVALGAALFVALGELLVLDSLRYGDLLRFDPMRMLEAVVAGVSFLAAGSIFFAKGEDRVKGLTTAASLWTTAGVGMCAALGRYWLAGGATLLALIVLRVLLHWERRIERRSTSARRDRER